MTQGLPVLQANDAVQHILDDAIARGIELGLQVAAYLGSTPIVDAWAGLADPAAGREVNGDTLFNVFSIAKSVTAVAVHIQAERGLIDYDVPIAAYWPEFSGDGRERVTVRHVLTHRSGMAEMPAEVTADQICDWDHMVRFLQTAVPTYEPGSESGYQSMTYGWLLGEIVRRTDPKERGFGDFVRQEIAEPLGIADLWLGLPDEAQNRMAMLDGSSVTVIPAGHPYRLTTPLQVDLMPEIFARPDVRRACIPAVGGIANARSIAGFYAMLANGGELDGVRLLSAERVAAFAVPRDGFDDIDRYFQRATAAGQGGFYLGGAPSGSSYAARNPRALCQSGMGGSFAMADPDTGLAFAFCNNRLADFRGDETDIRARLVRAIEATL